MHHERTLAAALNDGFAQRYCYNPAQKSAYVPPAVAQWAAFFGDVQHEVESVKSGYRLTLTYVLHRDSTPDPRVDMLLLRANDVHKALMEALDCADFLREGGSLGVYCKHEYEEKALSQAEALLAAGGTKAYASKLSLKNEDAVIGATAAAAGLKVSCLRLLSHTCICIQTHTHTHKHTHTHTNTHQGVVPTADDV